MLMDVKKRPESTNMTFSVLSKIMQGKVHFQWKNHYICREPLWWLMKF